MVETKRTTTTVTLQKTTKIDLDTIKAKLQISHDEVVQQLIVAWLEKNENKQD